MTEPTEHQFPAGNLTLLQGNREVDVLFAKDLPGLKIMFGIHSSDVSVQIGRLFRESELPFRLSGATKLNGFLESLEPNIELLGQR